MRLHYFNTFISAAPDCPAEGEAPKERGGTPTAATIQFDMLVSHPYRFTQEDVLFESSTEGRSADPEEKVAKRKAFFSRPQACLRTSPLAKRYGWGIHFNEEGKAAAYAVGSAEYEKFAADGSLEHFRAMRSRR